MSKLFVTREEFYKRLSPGIYVVLTDALWSFVSWKIKEHTKGFYNHMMLMRWPMMVVSQDWRLHEIPIADYMDGKHRVKLLKVPYATEQYVRLNHIVDEALGKHGKYDWLGIIGQWIGIRSLNFSSRYYCSERILDFFTRVCLYSGELQLSPGDIDERHKQLGWLCVAIYDPNYEKELKHAKS